MSLVGSVGGWRAGWETEFKPVSAEVTSNGSIVYTVSTVRIQNFKKKPGLYLLPNKNFCFAHVTFER